MKKLHLSSKFIRALILTVLCTALCSGCAAQAPAAETTPTPPPENWLPVLTVESHDANGAVLVFQQEQELGQSLVLSGNDYFLQENRDGTWYTLPTLTEEVNFITGAFVTAAIPREEVDWQWLYGTLSPGHYRIGKSVTLHHNAENLETATVYAEFSIDAPVSASAPKEEETVFTPEGTDLIQYKPLESLPDTYSREQAAADQVVILEDGTAVLNHQVMHNFAAKTAAGYTGTVRFYEQSTSDETHRIRDVVFDGLLYNLRWYEEGQEKVLSFKHLNYYPGDLYQDAQASDRYVLTMDSDVTWDDIQWGMVSSNPNDAVAHVVIYSERSYHPAHPPIPEASSVSLVLQGEPILKIKGEKVPKLVALFSQAEAMGERPQVYYRGLDLVLTQENGSAVTLWMDIHGNHFLYDGTFYRYSTEALFAILEIETWPEEVIFAHP